MAAICFWHVIIHGYSYMTPDHNNNQNLLFVSFCCTLFSPAVYCFMLISGWYGIKFSLKKYAHLSFMAVVCFCLSIIIRYFWGGIKPTIIVEFIFPLSCQFWWFLTCYAMVFLIAPFINLGFEQLDNKTIKQIMFIMTFIEITCLINLLPNRGSSFYGLLYIYCLGRFLNKKNLSISTPRLTFIYAISFLILWISVYWGYDIIINCSKLSFILLSYNNPCIILMAICIFFLFLKMRSTYNSMINLLFSDVLAIYLLTEGIDKPLYLYLANTMKNDIILGILMVFIVMFVSLSIGKIITMCFFWVWSKVST